MDFKLYKRQYIMRKSYKHRNDILNFRSWGTVCLTLAICAMALSQPVRAQAAEPAPAPTRIEVDERAHEIRFIVNGKTAAVLTEDGLVVDGDVKARSFAHGASSAAQDAEQEVAE